MSGLVQFAVTSASAFFVAGCGSLVQFCTTPAATIASSPPSSFDRWAASIALEYSGSLRRWMLLRFSGCRHSLTAATDQTAFGYGP